MVFPYGCIDIIFKKEVLERKGLLKEIIERYKPRKESIDDKLILVPCAMSPVDAGDQVEWLLEKGLVYVENKKAVDFVVVESMFGPCAPCDWVDYGLLKEEVVIDGITHKEGKMYYEFIDDDKRFQRKWWSL